MSRFVFNGTAKISGIEAECLRPTDYLTRLSSSLSSSSSSSHQDTFQLSPYVSFDIDDLPMAHTTTKHKTQHPLYSEEFVLSVYSGLYLNLTVYHDSSLLTDEFIANCRLLFHDLQCNKENDLWLDLEPHGRIHLTISLDGSFKGQSSGANNTAKIGLFFQ
jgi:Ca2+-dependent lipid-binding protein